MHLLLKPRQTEPRTTNFWAVDMVLFCCLSKRADRELAVTLE